MLESLFNSASKEKVLLYVAAREEGYAREIAKYFETELSPIQNQLNKLESGGILVSKSVGKTKVFSFNLRNPFYCELVNLLKKAIEFLPEKEKNDLIIYRKRPRRTGKPL
ncbi:MAG: ArsR family transcriptional regulator [Candidatus Kapabacteria bacterium]|jgi:hypothetical protein|nr:ArsR family transcriptional regulator [Candidatus Kapabacteria bacterium]